LRLVIEVRLFLQLRVVNRSGNHGHVLLRFVSGASVHGLGAALIEARDKSGVQPR